MKESVIYQDTIDVIVRQETLPFIPGHPVLLQICVVPVACYRIAAATERLRCRILYIEAYALSIHKTQSLSIKHVVRGCLEVSI